MLDIIINAIKESGMTKEFISNKLGISRLSLFNKLNGDYPFTLKEIKILIKLLNLNDIQILAIMKED